MRSSDSPNGTLSASISEARQLLVLAAPLIAAQITTVATNFVDTVMAGRLGPEALGAVAVGGSTWMTVVLTATGILMALPPTIARFRGAGLTNRIAPATWQTMWIGFALALVGMALLRSLRPLLLLLDVDPTLVPLIIGYLRAFSWGMPGLCGYLVLRLMSEGLALTRPAMYFGLLGVAINIVGNYALMFGRWGFPALGVIGCGYSTALVVWVQFIGLAIYVGYRSHYRDLALFRTIFRPDLGEIRELLRIGLPIGAANFIESSLFTSVALLLSSLSALAVAAHQIAINFAALSFMVPLGLSMAITVRVGHAEGRRDQVGVRRSGLTGMTIALMLQMVSASVMLIFPRFIAGMYTDDTVIIEAAVQLLFLAALFQLSDGLQVSAAGALRGLRDTRIPMFITVLAYWVIGLPLGWGLGFGVGLGARGMWVGLIAGLTVAAVLLSGRFLRLSKQVK
jgi:MATE family multidrug resistance protein